MNLCFSCIGGGVGPGRFPNEYNQWISGVGPKQTSVCDLLPEMQHRMGSGFTLLAHEAYTHTTPNDEPRPYIYALFQRLPTD